MLRTFWRDRSGQYAIAASIAMLPIFGALTLGIDYTQMSRERQEMLNALDASGIATARVILSGASDADAKQYAWDFFAANFPAANAQQTALTVTLPSAGAGGGTLKLSATHNYEPFFLDTFRMLLPGDDAQEALRFAATSEVRLKNTLEVALALDNSGSMDYKGGGSGKKRIDLLKEAAKQLVDTMAAQATLMKQVAKPVQFSLVPFASAVNVGATNASESWMDKTGVSPIHHENFDWAQLTKARNANRYAELVSGVWYARGSEWGSAWRDKPLTRFTMFDTMQRLNGASSTTKVKLTEWSGCVESRPYPLNTNDESARIAKPESMYVPMFAPDESSRTNFWGTGAENSWLADGTSSTDDMFRQKYMPKYWPTSIAAVNFLGLNAGPNKSCTTKPITPLVDVTNATGIKKIKDAIDEMAPLGATNVPEGLAWGWRTLSSGAPFTEGRNDTERGNDKVVIVLTDGANTYYTPGSLGFLDLGNNMSTYSAYGYTGVSYQGSDTRIMKGGKKVKKGEYTNSNYTVGMNDHFDELCTNAKAGNIVLMTVALDLDIKDATEKQQIDALSACASPSKYRKNSDGTAAKLFWNATGGSLANDFKSIADELSNLRIVG